MSSSHILFRSILARSPAFALRHLRLLLSVVAVTLLLSAPVRAQVSVDSVVIEGTDICTVVTNHSTQPVDVGMATYGVVEPVDFANLTFEDLDEQVFYQGKIVTVPPLSSIRTCVPIPPGVQPFCLFQFDIFLGPIIPVFKGSDYYIGRILFGWMFDTPTCGEEPGDEGCTPGYWKNHEESWAGTGYALAQTLESVFDIPNAYGLDNVSLHAALSLKGGPDVADKAALLCHHAVAALLNAAHADVDYPLSTAQIINQVNAALASGDGDAMQTLKNTLDAYNNGGCTLN